MPAFIFPSFQQPAEIFSQGTVWLRPLRPAWGWYGEGRGNVVVTNPKGLIRKVTALACKAADGFLPQPSPYQGMELTLAWPQTIENPLRGCTHCRGGFRARVSSVASLKASVCHHKGVSRAGEDVLAMRGKFHSARAETFHFHLVSSVLSCESYIRCETAVKTNICTLMEWNISSIFPFLKWIIGFFFPLRAKSRK